MVSVPAGLSTNPNTHRSGANGPNESSIDSRPPQRAANPMVNAALSTEVTNWATENEINPKGVHKLPGGKPLNRYRLNQ